MKQYDRAENIGELEDAAKSHQENITADKDDAIKIEQENSTNEKNTIFDEVPTQEVIGLLEKLNFKTILFYAEDGIEQKLSVKDGKLVQTNGEEFTDKELSFGKVVSFEWEQDENHNYKVEGNTGDLMSLMKKLGSTTLSVPYEFGGPPPLDGYIEGVGNEETIVLESHHKDTYDEETSSEQAMPKQITSYGEVSLRR